MALRGTAGNYANAGTVVVSLTGITGLALGDVLVCLFGSDNSPATLTFPTGYATTISGCANQNLSSGQGSDSVGISYGIVSGSVPTSLTFTASGSHLSAQVRAYSGRSATQFSATALTSTGSTANMPVTFSITGVTASANDDVCVLIGGTQTATGTDAITYTPSSGFANGLATYNTTSQYSPILVSSDKVGVSAGATGTIAGTIADTQGNNYSYAGYVLSIAALGATNNATIAWVS